DALVADARDLLGEALEQPVVDGGQGDALHAGFFGVLDPQLAGAVDQDLGDAFAFEPGLERGEIGVEIDAAVLGRDVRRNRGAGGIAVGGHGVQRRVHWAATFEKSRSLAVNTRIGWPWR